MGFSKILVRLVVLVSVVLCVLIGLPELAEANFGNGSGGVRAAEQCYNCHVADANGIHTASNTNPALNFKVAVNGGDVPITMSSTSATHSSNTVNVTQGTTAQIDFYNQNGRGNSDTTCGYLIETPAAINDTTNWGLSQGLVGTAPASWTASEITAFNAFQADTGDVFGWSRQIDDGAKNGTVFYENHWIQEYSTGGNGTKACGAEDGTDFGIAIPATALGAYVLNIRMIGHDDGGGRQSAIVAVNLNVQAAGNTTSVADGTDPGNSTVAPGATTILDNFSVSTSAGTDSITALSVTTYNTAAISSMQIWDSTGTTTQYFGAGSLTGDVWSFSGGTAIPASTSATDFTVKVTFKDHATLASAIEYNVGGTVTAITSTNSNSVVDTDSAVITVDNAPPANASWGTITPGDNQIVLNWTNPSDTDFNEVVIVRNTSATSDTPAEGTDYSGTEGSPITADTVVYVGNLQTFTDTTVSNGTGYYYEIFAKDTYGNYATGVAAPSPPYTPAAAGNITTLGDGTDPAATPTLAPGGATTVLDRLSFVTDGNSDVVTALTVTLAPAGAFNNIDTVAITSVGGGTTYGSASSLASNTVSITLSTNTLTATNSSTEYEVRITPKSHANMPAIPGAQYATTGTVTAFTPTSNSTAGTDTNSDTVTIDNLSPTDPADFAGVPSDAQVALSWSNPGGDFNEVVITQRELLATSENPTEGNDYSASVGSPLVANDNIIYVGSGTSHTATTLNNGNGYYFEIFYKDSNGNYSAGTAIGPLTPNVVNVAPDTPFNLAQFEDDGSTGLGDGATAPTNIVVLQADLSDTNTGDKVMLEFDFNIDGGGYDGTPDCTSAFVTADASNVKATCAGLVDGSYAWQVQAKDIGGLTSATWTTASTTFVIATGMDIGVDTTAPGFTGLIGSPADQQITLSWNAATDTGSGIDPVNTYKIVYNTDTASIAAPADCDSGISLGFLNGTQYVHSGLNNGEYYSYRVCAYDRAGNIASQTSVDVIPSAAASTIVDDGTSPVAKWENGSLTDPNAVSTFVLRTSSGADTVTRLVFTATAGSDTSTANVKTSGVKLWVDNGTVANEWDASDTAVANGTASFSSGVADFNTVSISVDATPVQYLVTIDMGATPNNGTYITGHITTAEATNVISNFDNDDATIYFDTASPTVDIAQDVAGGQTDPTNSLPILFVATFSEEVTTPTGTAIDFTGSTAGGVLAATVTEIAPNDGTTYRVSVSGATTAGDVVVAVKANSVVDNAGNNNTASANLLDRTVHYDATAPVIGTVTPASVATATFVDGTFNLSATVTDTGTISGCEYCATADGTCDTEWAAATFAAGTCSQTGITGFTDGDILTLNIRATDNASNVGTGTPVARTVDSSAPTTSDDGPWAWSATDVTVNLTADDGTGSGVATGTEVYGCFTTGCTPASLGGLSMTTSCTAGTVCDDAVLYYSIDNVGNQESTVTSANNVRVDKENPTDFTGSVSAAPADNSAMLTWTDDASDGSGSGIPATGRYKVVRATGGTAPADCTVAGTLVDAGSYTDNTVSNGTQYSYRVCTVDNVGNISAGKTVSVTPGAVPSVNSGATVSVTLFGGTYVDSPFTITAEFNENGSAITSCEYTTDGAIWNPAGSPTDLSGGNWRCQVTNATCTDDTDLTVNMRATNGIGAAAASVVNVTCDTVAPVTNNNIPSAWQSTDYNVTLTPNDDPGSDLKASGVQSTAWCYDTAGTCTPGTNGTSNGNDTSVEVNTCAAGTICVYKVRYASTDNVGNVETTKTATNDMRIDKEKPADGTLTASALDSKVSLSWSGFSDGSGSGLSSSDSYKLVFLAGGTAPAVGCTNGTDLTAVTTGSSYTHTGLTNTQQYSYRICAIDNAGNVSDGVTDTATPQPNNAPVAVDDTGVGFTTTEDGGTYTTADVRANDTDTEDINPTGAVAVVTGVSNGTLVNNGDGTFDYTPDADFFGSDSFTYNVKDSVGDTSNNATVTITVTGVDDNPTAANGAKSTQTTINYIFKVADFNFVDVDGDAMQAVEIGTGNVLPSEGTVYIDADGDGVVDGGEGIAAAQTVTVATIAAGQLKYYPGTVTNSPYTFDFRVQDDSASNLWSGTYTMTLNVTVFFDELVHSSLSTGSAYHTGKWGTGQSGAKYGEFTCSTCHTDTPTNIKRIKSTISTEDGSNWDHLASPDVTVVFNSVTGPGSFGDDDPEGDGLATMRTTSNRICEVCHSATTVHRYDISSGVTDVNHKFANATDCISCHPHKQGFRPLACDACHGDPPTTNDTDGSTNTGLVWDPVVTNSATVGAHNLHASTLGFGCGECHQGFVMPNDGDIDINFVNFGSTTGTYVGQNGVSYNGVLYTGPTTKECSNVYCHGSTLSAGSDTTPIWNEPPHLGSAAFCGTCHGADATTPPTTGSHTKHAGTAGENRACSDCHGPGYTGGTVAPSGHVDGSVIYNVTALPNTGSNATYGGSSAGATGALAPSATYSSCANTWCHDPSGNSVASPVWDASLSNAGDCSDCHGNDATISSGEGTMASGKHTAHVNNSDIQLGSFDCGYCHADTVTVGANRTITGSAKHVDETVDVVYNATQNPSGAAGSCANLYCHSNGKGDFVNRNLATEWSSATTLDCTGCHGNTSSSFGEPDYSNAGAGQPKANSHAKHVSALGDCTICHVSTVDNTQDMISGTLHLDGTIDVTIANAYDTGDSDPTNNYNTGSKQCSNISCHGSGTPTWGGAALSCSDCHLAATGAGTQDIDDFVYQSGSNMALIDSDEWTFSGHGVASGDTYEVTGRAGADFEAEAGTGSACLYCHDDSVSHGQANFFRLRNLANNGTCLNCHATGSSGVDPGAAYNLVNSTVKIDKYHAGAKHNGTDRDAGTWCWDCHDPHGDADAANQRIQMVQRHPQRDPNASGVPSGAVETLYNSADVVFYDNTLGAAVGGFARDITGAGAAAGICNTCHSTTAQYTGTTGKGSHSTSQCTTCHEHSADTTYDEFAFAGAGCSGCHGGGSTGSSGSQTDNLWPDDSSTNAENDDGRHAVHMKILAKVIYNLDTIDALLSDATSEDKQRNLCSYCHQAVGVNDDDHGDPTNLPAEVFTTTVSSVSTTVSKPLWWASAADDDTNATYNVGADTCATVDCHNNLTTPKVVVGGPNNDIDYGWYGTLDNLSGTTDRGGDCTMCHVTGGTTNIATGTINPNSGNHALIPTVSGVTHDETLDAAGCEKCHTALPLVSSTSSHMNGTAVADGASNTDRGLFADYTDAVTGSCMGSTVNASGCHSNGAAGEYNGGNGWRRRWSDTASNTDGTECANCHGGFASDWTFNGALAGNTDHQKDWDNDNAGAAKQSVSAATISFNTADDSINAIGLLGGFTNGTKIYVTGSTSNNGIFNITSVSANKITVSQNLTTESAGSSVTLASAEVIGNHNGTSQIQRCTICHLYEESDGTGYIQNGNSSIGWVGNASNNSTYHGDGNLQVNNAFGYDSATWSCASACHAGASNTGHSMEDSGWALDERTGPSLNCTDCHGGAAPAAGVSSSSTHVIRGKNATSAGALGGTWNVFHGCEDCHPSTKHQGGDVFIRNNPKMGINYTVAGSEHVSGGNGGFWLGGDATTGTTEAQICWNCHTDTARSSTIISEWGTNTGGSYDYGRLAPANWVGATWSSAQDGTGGKADFTYKTGTIESTHSVNDVDSNAATNGVDSVGNIRCSYCHDVHNTADKTGVIATANDPDGKPFLRGKWLSNPYREDGAPRAGTVYASQGVFGAVPRGGTGATEMGGYQIDQNNGNPTNGLSAYDVGGLCETCHGGGGTGTAGDGSFDADEIDALNYYGTDDSAGWVGSGNGHSSSVLGGSGSGASNIFSSQDRMPGETGNLQYTGSGTFNSKPVMAYRNATGQRGYGFRATNTNGPTWRLNPPTTDSKDQPYAYNGYNWGARIEVNMTNDSFTDANYHKFSCSKCHNPHASRLPKLMITNCLDTRHNTWDDTANAGIDGLPSSGVPAYNQNKTWSNSSSAQNCHRRGDSTQSGAGSGWNNVTPWTSGSTHPDYTPATSPSSGGM